MAAEMKSILVPFGASAFFARSNKKCYLSVTAANATVVINPVQDYYISTDNISVTVSPNEGYEISQLSSYSSENVFISGAGGSYTVNTFGEGSIVFNIILSEEQPGSGDTVPDFSYIGAVVGEVSEFSVNEEIFFSAEPTTFQSGVYPDRSTTRNGFSWDFGDGYTASGYYGGVSVTHMYRKPGIYSVSLSVFDSLGVYSTCSKNISIVGNEPKIAPRAEDTAKSLELKFENGIEDTSINENSVLWVGEGDPEYADGKEGRCLDCLNGYLRIADNSCLDGFSNGFAFSFWAKRRVSRDGGVILQKQNVFKLELFASGVNNDVFQATISKGAPDSGSIIVSNWFIPRDTAWHQYSVVFDIVEQQVSMYVDGYLRSDPIRNPLSFSSDLSSSSYDLFIGADSSGNNRWTGYLDEVKIFNRTLSSDELTYGFETFHGDFHCRIKQTIDYFIPSDLTENYNNKLEISLRNSDSEEVVLYEKTDLSNNESFVFDQSNLLSDSYVLVSRVLDESGNELDIFEEPFLKQYDNLPRVGIDENNAICLNGTPFFPVTSFGLNNADIDNWTTDRVIHPENYGGEVGTPLSPIINVLCSQGNYPTTYNYTTWGTYIALGTSNGVASIGPGSPCDRGAWATGISYGARYTLPSKLIDYISTYKNNTSLLSHGFKDEPDLGSAYQLVPPAVLRSWLFLSHYYAPEQLIYINLCGPSFVYNLAESGGEYSYSYSGTRNLFGRQLSVADIISYDYYPYDWRITRRSENCSIEGMLTGLEIMKTQNKYNPVMSFVETGDIRDDNTLKGANRYAYYTDLTPMVTVDQIKMLCWLHVIMGYQGVSWFAYFNDFEPLLGYGQLQNAITVTEGSTTVVCVRGYFSRAFVGRYIYISNGSSYIKKQIDSCTNAYEIELSSAWTDSTRETGYWYADGAWLMRDFMSEFVEQTTELADVVLASDSLYSLVVEEDEGSVLFVVKEKDGEIYIIAVRKTEMCGPQPGSTILNSGTASAIIPSSGYYNDAEEWVEYGSIGDNVPVANKNVTFTMNEISGKTITVLYEDRTITPSGSSFVDAFDKCEVHIYKLS